MEKKEPSYIVGGNVNWYSHYGKQYGAFLKTKNRATIWSSNPIPGHISGENHNSKRYMHPKVHSSTIYNSQDMEQLKCPSTDEWIKMWYVVYIHNGILFSHIKEWNNAICSNMYGPTDCHTKWSKSDREREISYDITYMWNLKNGYKWTYLQNRNRVTDVENKLMVMRGWRGGINWELKSTGWRWHELNTIFMLDTLLGTRDTKKK